MTINQELFAKIHDQITRHPETHDQSTFEWCGTTRCVAGWALAFSAVDGENIFLVAKRITGDADTGDADLGELGRPAAQLLGLTDDEGFELFFELNNVKAAELVELYATHGREWKGEPVTLTPEQVLLQAADDLAKYGHHKGYYFKSTAEYATSPACAMGAIERALGMNFCQVGQLDPEEYRRRRALRNQARTLLGQTVGTWHIPTWNDDPDTSAEDVILAMKKAAHHDT